MFVIDHTGRLWSESLGGGPRTEIGAGELLAPEDFALDDTHRLWVVDSGHHRLVVFVMQGGYWTLERALPARSESGLPSIIWPMRLARGGKGSWWVAQSDRFGRAAELLIHHPDGMLVRISLPVGVYPDALAAAGEAVLVADARHFRIYRVALRSGKVAEFGDRAFREHLQDIARQRDNAFIMGWLLVVATFGTLMIVAAVAATPPGKGWRKAQAAGYGARNSAGLANSGMGLQPNEPAERIKRQVAALAWVVALLIGFSLWLVYIGLDPLDILMALFLPIGFLFVCANLVAIHYRERLPFNEFEVMDTELASVPNSSMMSRLWVKFRLTQPGGRIRESMFGVTLRGGLDKARVSRRYTELKAYYAVGKMLKAYYVPGGEWLVGFIPESPGLPPGTGLLVILALLLCSSLGIFCLKVWRGGF